jgi:hypothetical protein
MKYIAALLSIGCLAVLALGIGASKSTAFGGASQTTTKAPVVVELFTSEGCSSCPPADTLLKKLEEEQPVGNAEVIALEEHVDYWNQQGWTDPFSSPDATFRQQQYAATFKSDAPYTPQMIVDGRSEFVGSRERQARDEIEQAAKTPRVEISLTPKSSMAKGAEQFSVQVAKLTGDSAEVWLAVTERQLHSDVKAGENAGENLHHAAVVRSLRKIGDAKPGNDVAFTGNPNVKIDSKWKLENLHVVVFAQEKKSRHIIGAAAVPLT